MGLFDKLRRKTNNPKSNTQQQSKWSKLSKLLTRKPKARSIVNVGKGVVYTAPPSKPQRPVQTQYPEHINLTGNHPTWFPENGANKQGKRTGTSSQNHVAHVEKIRRDLKRNLANKSLGKALGNQANQVQAGKSLWTIPTKLTASQIRKIQRFLKTQYFRGLTSIDQAQNQINRIKKSNGPSQAQNLSNARQHKQAVERMTQSVHDQLTHAMSLNSNNSPSLDVFQSTTPYKFLVSKDGKVMYLFHNANNAHVKKLRSGWTARNKRLGSATPLPNSTLEHGKQLMTSLGTYPLKNSMYVSKVKNAIGAALRGLEYEGRLLNGPEIALLFYGLSNAYRKRPDNRNNLDKRLISYSKLIFSLANNKCQEMDDHDEALLCDAIFRQQMQQNARKHVQQNKPPNSRKRYTNSAYTGS